ncbi:MAG TPA: hypothetical protein VHO25_23035, partial [Polyangiaceae bacterium]|nr:hypothetical protein [Polyangiaceae bacterium]
LTGAEIASFDEGRGANIRARSAVEGTDADDTDDLLKLAIAQFWQWSNWQSNNKLMVRYGGATGSCLVEVVDNTERGKITTAVRWPGLLADRAKDDGPSLILDDVGNVKFYALEYEATDDKGDTYTYRKEVSQESFVEYRDDKVTVESPNPYGFVPAVWCKHVDEGWGMDGEGVYGAPAISGSIGKIDELNGLAAHTHDHIDALIDSPGIISSDGGVGRIGEQANAIKASRSVAQDEFSTAGATSAMRTLRRLLLKAPKGAAWVPLTGNLQPEQAIPAMDHLLTEIEHDFPELGMYQELRKMSEVTGPGAARMMGDVYSRVLEVASNYDQQSIKLFQMAAAIGGFRYRENREGWRLRTEAQSKFAPFNLDSYARGELNMAIMPRPLIPMTEDDTITLIGKRLDNAKKAQGIFNDEKVLEVAGVPEDERAAILAERAREKEEALLNMPAVPTNGGVVVQ